MFKKDAEEETSCSDTGDVTEVQSPTKQRRVQEMQLLRKLSTPGAIQQISEGSSLSNTLKEQIEEELCSYMGLILTNEEMFDFDLLSFWKRSAKSFPILSKLARVIHCIPASSVEIERVWSRAGLIMTDRRSRMNNWNFKINLFCSKNLDLVKTLHEPC